MSFVEKISEPVYFHREYENDFISVEKEEHPENSWLDLSRRVVCASLPFFSLYQPLSFPISLGFGGVRAVNCLRGIFASETKTEVGYAFLQTAIATIALAGTIFAHPIGMLVSTGHDLIFDVARLVEHVMQGASFEEIGEDFLSIVNNAFYLALFFQGGLELAVISLAVQMITGLYHARAEFKKDHYIEAIGHLLMVFVRGKQFVDQSKMLRLKWQQKSEYTVLEIRTISGENGERKIERRAAIDVGSGGTKIFIADVDVETNEIVCIVLEKSLPVPYQAALEQSENKIFEEWIQEEGLETFREIKEILNEHEVEAVTAIATQAFRQAQNGAEFAEKVQETTGIPLRIISQEQEGLIAYQSALAVNHGDPNQTIVWDIGTGSFQITMKQGDEDFEVFDKGLGAVPFKNEVLYDVQHKNPGDTSPRPVMTPEEYKEAGRLARMRARQASHEAKLKLKSKEVEVVGIGRLFQNSVHPVAGKDGTITRDGLRTYIRGVMDGSIPLDPDDPYAFADFTNCIQVLETMKALHIQEIHVVDTTSTKGLITGSSQDFSSWGVA